MGLYFSVMSKSVPQLFPTAFINFMPYSPTQNLHFYATRYQNQCQKYLEVSPLLITVIKRGDIGDQATSETVWAAADALTAAGKEPTVLLLREEIGGSFTTLQKHLRSWQDRRRESEATPMPEGVQRLATQLGQAVWRAATVEANQAVQMAKTTLAVAQAERDQAIGEVARLEREAEARNAQLTKLKQRACVGPRPGRGRCRPRGKTCAPARNYPGRAHRQSAAQFADAVAAIQSQLAEQVQQLQRSAQGRDQESK